MSFSCSNEEASNFDVKMKFVDILLIGIHFVMSFYVVVLSRDFKLDEKQKVMHIPPSNKPEYLRKIRELAEAEGFTIDVQEVV